MAIPLKESAAARYIYINPTNNLVHLFVPIVGGDEISTDNTCQTWNSLYTFFVQGEGLRELRAYQSALKFDLRILDDDHPLKKEKQHRLEQINDYIAAFKKMKATHRLAIERILQKRSNLYFIQLRPQAQDLETVAYNPVFSIERKNNQQGEPLSALYNAMHAGYSKAQILPLSPQDELTQAVLALLSERSSFEDIQRILSEQCSRLFEVSVNFSLSDSLALVDKPLIDRLMGFTPEYPATPRDYIDTLINFCAPNLSLIVPAPPFYTVRNNMGKTEKLSLLTQFYLAHATVYCRAQGISIVNFGAVLDSLPALCEELVHNVLLSLEAGARVEENISAFLNKYSSHFGMTRTLSDDDIEAINHKFTKTYRVITATSENTHMDDFMILDTANHKGLFATHQGAICTDFTELTELMDEPINYAYFKEVRADFETLSERVFPSLNPHIQCDIDISIESLLNRIKDESDFDQLPSSIQEECRSHPKFLWRKFLFDVAQGKQDEAELILADEADSQALIQHSATFTDYSGRTFQCSAYEYAYWAGDGHMRRMLERNMNTETRAIMYDRCEVIERDGLNYEQNGILVAGSRCFDFRHLKVSMEAHVLSYFNLRTQGVLSRELYLECKRLWLYVGRALRDVPAHIAHEFCRGDHSFATLDDRFTEPNLPRGTICQRQKGSTLETLSWFPLLEGQGLGFDYAVMRGKGTSALATDNSYTLGRSEDPLLDFEALLRLEEVMMVERLKSTLYLAGDVMDLSSLTSYK